MLSGSTSRTAPPLAAERRQTPQPAEPDAGGGVPPVAVPALGLDQPVDDVEQGRLPGAGRADDRDRLPRRDVEVDVLERGRGALLRDRDPLQGQAAPAPGVGVVCLRGLARVVQQLEDAGGRARGAGHQVGEVADLVGGDAEDAGEAEEGHELAERDPSVDDRAAAERENEAEADVGDEVEHGAVGGVEAAEAQVAAEQRRDRARELRPLAALEVRATKISRAEHGLSVPRWPRCLARLVPPAGRRADARAVVELDGDGEPATG